MNAKITEIFYSIQGEGKYIGVPQVFVRFFGCNMFCEWCDTPQSIGGKANDRFEEYGLEDIFKEIEDFWGNSHSISITGGEPLVQVDFLQALLPRLKQENKKVYLETNSVLPEALEKVISDVDIISADIKLSSSTGDRSFWKEHIQFLKIAKQKDLFVKTVITNKTLLEEVGKAAQLVAGIDKNMMFILQPNHMELTKGVVARCQEAQKICQKFLSDVRIMPQTHKFLKLR